MDAPSMYRDAAVLLRVELEPDQVGRHAAHLSSARSVDHTRVTWAGGWPGAERIDVSFHRDSTDSGPVLESRYTVACESNFLPPVLGIDIKPRKGSLSDRWSKPLRDTDVTSGCAGQWIWLSDRPARGEVGTTARFSWGDRNVPPQYGTPRTWLPIPTRDLASGLIDRQAQEWFGRN